MSRAAASAAVAALVAATTATPALADRTWTRGGGDNFWTTPGNWSGGVVPNGGEAALFTDTGAGTVDLNGSSQPSGGGFSNILFNNATTGYTVQDSANFGTLFTSALTNSSGAAVTNTVSATVFTNTLTVNSGTLVLSNANNTINGPVTIAAGAKLDVQAPSSQSIGSVSLNGGTLLVRSGSTTLSGLQGQLYVNTQLDPRNNAAGVNTLIATAPNATNLNTSASTPAGINFNSDNDVATFFNNTQVGNGGNNNYTMAFVGKYTPTTTGLQSFSFTKNDDNSAVYIDSNQNGTFETGEQVLVGGCCGPNGPSTVTLTAGQTYKIAILNEETGGGSTLVANYAEPGGTLAIITPGAAGQTEFTSTTFSPANISGSAITVTANSTIDVESTTGTIGAITFNTGTTLTVQSTLAGIVTLGGLSGTGTGTLSTSTATVGGALSGFTTFTKTGTSPLTLGTDAPSFAGNVVVGAGQLILKSANALGSSAGNTLVTSGAQLSIAFDGSTEPVTINGTGTATNGALESGALDSASHSFAGPITLGSDSFIVSSQGGQTFTLTGGITNGGFQTRIGGAGDTMINTTGISGSGGVLKTEAGTATIGAASSYTGVTQVNAGTFAFTGALTGTSAINLTAGTINAGAAVNPAAAINVTAGTYNANAAGALAGTSNITGFGIVRVTTAVGAAGPISVNSGTLRFDPGSAGTASVTTPSGNINVDNLGTVHAASGIADLSTQNIVVNPRSTQSVNNTLQQTVYAGVFGVATLNPIDSGTGILTRTPTRTSSLAGPLSFTQAQLDTAAGQADQYSFAWRGKVTVATAGTYSFGTTSDDGSIVYIDINKNGSFADAGELIVDNNRDQGDHAMTGTVVLQPGTYPIVFGYYENGGGSNMTARNAAGSVTTFTSQSVVDPTAPPAGLSYSSDQVVGGGVIQVGPGAELRARTITGATTGSLQGTVTLTAGTAGAPLASDIATINAGGATNLNIGAFHTLTSQTLTTVANTTVTKSGAGTFRVTGNTGVTLDGSSVVASAGVMDLSNVRLTGTAQTVISGLQGRLYVNNLTDPRAPAAGGAGASGVATLLNTVPTATAQLTSANGPNGGLDFRSDNDVATFFNNNTVGQVGGAGTTGNNNYTMAFVGRFTANSTGTHKFGFEQNDDNSAVYVDLNRNGAFEDNERVEGRGCCLQNPPNADSEYNLDNGVATTANLVAGQTYNIAIINEETGGGSDLGAGFQEPSGPNSTTPVIIAPGAANQTTQFTFSTGGGTVQVNAGAVLNVAGTSAVDLTLAGTMSYVAQATPTTSDVKSVTVAASQTGTLDIQTNQTLNVPNTASFTLNGNLVKTGAGRLAVNAAGTGTGSVSVTGGTLGGTGSIAGPVSVANGGTVAPGNSVGTLGTGNFSIASAGGTLGIELDPTNSGGLGTTDNLNVTGTVTLTGGNLAITLLSPITVGQQFQIITNDGSDPSIPGFTTANGSPIVGNAFTVPGGSFTINYAAGTGNDVVLTATAVPEPASLSMLALGAAGLLARRRRRCGSR